MVTSQPTSRQLKGHFNALRASKSHSAAQTIDLAAGVYGSGKFFAGASGVSAAAWVGATSTFYVYLDKDENLVLDGTSFPDLSTRIARVVLVAGSIFDVIDERAVVNGLEDAYQVGFNDLGLTIVQGDDVQEALESIDAYISSLSITTGIDIVKYKDFDINGGVLNGRADFTHVSGTPAIDFPHRTSGIARARYTVSVPEDYVTGTNIVAKVFWSASDAGAGDVRFRLRYRSIMSSSEDVDTAFTVVVNIQSTTGITNRLTDTASNLSISSGDISPNDMLVLNVERDFNNAGDTYGGDVRIHLVRLEYTGRGVS